MDGIKDLARALEAFATAYERRTMVEKERLDFERDRDARHAFQTAEKLALDKQREARIARKEAG